MQSKQTLPFIAVAFSLLLMGTAMGQQLKTPLLTLDPPRLLFDTTFCNTTKCATLVFRNDGDTVLEVTSMDAIESPFAGQINLPFTLLPGQTHQVEFCFTPTNAPSADSQVVEFVADTRVSNSFALCLDVTANMLGELEPGMTYFDALTVQDRSS